MFLNLYSSIINSLQYFLPQKKGQLTSWEKKWLERISEGDGYRLVTAESDAVLASKITTLSKAANLKTIPKLVIYRDSAPEAKSLWNGTILISTGALRKLTSDELDALLAHEIGHNCHKKTSILVDPIFAISVLLLAAFSTKAIINAVGGKAKNGSSCFNILGLSALFSGCAAIIAEIVNIPRMAFNRALENDADRAALLLTGKTEALKSLFLKFKKEEEEDQFVKPIPPTSHVNALANPLSAEKQQQSVSCRLLKELLRSHPYPEERIAHIERLQKELNNGKEKNLSLTYFW